MSATRISLVLLIAMFVILLLYKIRKLRPQVTGYGSQRMCPFCGLITSRLKARLPGVWPLSHGGECDPGYREIEPALPPQVSEALIVRNQKHER